MQVLLWVVLQCIMSVQDMVSSKPSRILTQLPELLRLPFWGPAKFMAVEIVDLPSKESTTFYATSTIEWYFHEPTMHKTHTLMAHPQTTYQSWHHNIIFTPCNIQVLNPFRKLRAKCLIIWSHFPSEQWFDKYDFKHIRLALQKTRLITPVQQFHLLCSLNHWNTNTSTSFSCIWLWKQKSSHEKGLEDIAANSTLVTIEQNAYLIEGTERMDWNMVCALIYLLDFDWCIK